MTLSLTVDDRRKFGTALTALLSPLASGDADQWRRAALRSVQDLLGADHAFGIFELPGVPTMYTEESELAAGIAAYGAYFHTVDEGVTERRKQLGRSVYTRAMVYDESHLGEYEIYVDWCIPYRLFDPLVMTADDVVARAFPIPATLAFYHDRESTPRFGDRGVAMLELLMPAFHAGAATATAVARGTDGLGAMIDVLDSAIALHDAGGALLHRNPALERLLLSEREAPRLVGAALRLARLVGSTVTSATAVDTAGALLLALGELRTQTTRYRIRPSLLDAGLSGGRPLVMLLFERVAVDPLGDGELRTRYRLSPREIEVARHLGRGDGGVGIATRLGISIHTVRRHTEHVLAKLGLQRRSQVAALLHGAG